MRYASRRPSAGDIIDEHLDDAFLGQELHVLRLPLVEPVPPEAVTERDRMIETYRRLRGR